VYPQAMKPTPPPPKSTEPGPFGPSRTDSQINQDLTRPAAAKPREQAIKSDKKWETNEKERKRNEGKCRRNESEREGN
jgi:hypothetical protein